MATQQLSVLIIDDNLADVELLRRRLQAIPDWDEAFFACGSGREALASLERRAFDIVFLDYLLGGETGLTLLAPIKQTGHARAVIMLTGQGSEEIAVEAMKGGADDYLVKGRLFTGDLRRAVLNAVEKAGLRRRVHEQQQALLVAERHRVMFESLGAVCHHLAQPLTSMAMNLSTLKTTPSIPNAKKQALLGECIKATERLAQVLERLRAIREYRTTPYISNVNILDLGIDQNRKQNPPDG